MSSLCLAVAVCGVAMPMHPKQNLAAANRYGAPLFLRKSHQRFSLPFLRVTMLRSAFAFPVCASQCHCTAVHLIAFAVHCSERFYAIFAVLCRCKACQCQALPLLRTSRPCSALLGLALPCSALLCLCQSVPLAAWLSRCHSAPYIAFAHLLKSRQCRCASNLRSAIARPRPALPSPCPASANQGRQCHALALRLSPHRQCK